MEKKTKYQCGSCKTEVNDSQKFCGECGTQLAPIQDARIDPNTHHIGLSVQFKDEKSKKAFKGYIQKEVPGTIVEHISASITDPKDRKKSIAVPTYWVYFTKDDKSKKRVDMLWWEKLKGPLGKKLGVEAVYRN